MKTHHLVWLVLPIALLVASAGGAVGEATLSVAPVEGPILTPIVATGTGFSPGQNVEIVWSTMAGNRVSGSGFEEVLWPVGTATADSAGALRFEFAAPADLGGPPHPVLAMEGETVLAQTTFMVTRTATISPTSGPAGTVIELHMTGGGWTEYDNIVTVNYDNAYLGYMCSFNTQGNMTTWITATGGPGLHTIDVWPALYTGPSTGAMPWKLPHLSTGDQPWQPPAFHFEFTITDGAAPVRQEAGAPPSGGQPDDVAPALVAAAAGAFAAVAASLEVPIRRSHAHGRKAPVAAAAVMLSLSLLAALTGPASAAETPPAEPPIVWMAAGGGPALGLSSGTSLPGDPLTITGSGFSPGVPVEVRWSTVEVETLSEGQKFMGWGVTPSFWTLGTPSASLDGTFVLTVDTPFDYGGLHQVSAIVGGALLASAGLVVVPYFEVAGPTSVKAGEPVTVAGYGLGYEKYSTSWNVLYDNRLAGWVSGLESHGNVTFTLYAVGEPGIHAIDVHEGAVGFPYLNLHESPFQNRPPGHLTFVITGDAGPAQVPAAGSTDVLLGVALGGAITAAAVQGMRWRSATTETAARLRGR